MHKSALIVGFILVVLIQLAVPASMIFEREQVLQDGTVYLFKTRPVDPTDPFRGKYIVLNYEANNIVVSDVNGYARGAEVFVTFEVGEDGFAETSSISTVPPTHTKTYLKTTVSHLNEHTQRVYVDLPFNRYYMEETKAPEAERMYNEANREEDKLHAHAAVSIQSGKAVLQEVFIDDMPIKAYLEATSPPAH